jgi:NADH-quinone oxidoreductase subunit I
MNGIEILKGLGVTLKHFIETYLEDFKWGRKRYYTKEGIARRKSSETKGIFTIQYPEEKNPLPEAFRYIPFLVYDEDSEGKRKLRCTSCGICAKVCPPQCIWIVRGNDPETGRPIQTPKEFYIDIDICMSCGLCAEFCPFESIKMDHDYEIADYERYVHHQFDLEKLSKSALYYAAIRPEEYEAELVIRAEKAAKTSAGRKPDTEN